MSEPATLIDPESREWKRVRMLAANLLGGAKPLTQAEAGPQGVLGVAMAALTEEYGLTSVEPFEEIGMALAATVANVLLGANPPLDLVDVAAFLQAIAQRSVEMMQTVRPELIPQQDLSSETIQ